MFLAILASHQSASLSLLTDNINTKSNQCLCDSFGVLCLPEGVIRVLENSPGMTVGQNSSLALYVCDWLGKSQTTHAINSQPPFHFKSPKTNAAGSLVYLGQVVINEALGQCWCKLPGCSTGLQHWSRICLGEHSPLRPFSVCEPEEHSQHALPYFTKASGCSMYQPGGLPLSLIALPVTVCLILNPAFHVGWHAL